MTFEFQIYKVDNVARLKKKQHNSMDVLLFAELYRNNITTISKAYEAVERSIRYNKK